MKRYTLLLLIIISLGFVFQSCKKGENDPFLSLRSRKARITGEWILKSGTTTITENDTTEVLTYDGINAVSSINGSFPLTEKWKINKNSSFERIIHNNGNVFTYKGNWTFNHKNKEADIKNKEAVTFVYEYFNAVYAGGTGNYTETYSGIESPATTYIIDELKNKEMIFSNDGTESWPDYSKKKTGSFTYIQEKK